MKPKKLFLEYVRSQVRSLARCLLHSTSCTQYLYHVSHRLPHFSHYPRYRASIQRLLKRHLRHNCRRTKIIDLQRPCKIFSRAQALEVCSSLHVSRMRRSKQNLQQHTACIQIVLVPQCLGESDDPEGVMPMKASQCLDRHAVFLRAHPSVIFMCQRSSSCIKSIMVSTVFSISSASAS